MITRKSFYSLFLTSVLTLSTAEAQHLTIVTANDTHSMIQPDADGKGGLLRHKAVVDSIRKADQNVVAINAGDAVQGTVYFSMFKGEVEYAALDSVGYDFCVLGNHEFDNHIGDMAKYYKNLKTVPLSANYDFTDTPCDGVFKPYVIRHYGDKKVAFMGINLNPRGMIADKNIGGLVFNDAITVAMKLSEYLKTTGMADYVVMVSHIGYTSTEGDESDVVIAKVSKYIDLIIGGHSHTLVDPNNPKEFLIKNAAGKMVPVCQEGKYGKHLGKIDFDLATGEVKYSHIPIDASLDRSAEKYTDMKAWLKPYDDEVYRVMHSRIASTARAMTNAELTYLPNFVCDAVADITAKRWGKVDFAMMNRGGIRQPLPEGDIAEGMINAMLPFDNKLVVLKVKGSDLLEAFRVMTYRDGDAVSRELDIKFKGHDIVYAKLNGKDIKPNKEYTMVTIDYLANGGDYMESLRKCERLFVDTVPYSEHILQYIKDLDAKGKKIDTEGRVRMHK